MKLTELKDKIDEALKMNDDYEVVMKTSNDEIIPHIDDCNIGPGRRSFMIDLEDFGCEEYHIDNDEDMEYCSTCDIYYPESIKCPGCELNRLKTQTKKIHILYDDFDYRIEKVSTSREKMEKLCKEYNGEGDLGPYCVIPVELEVIED